MQVPQVQHSSFPSIAKLPTCMQHMHQPMENWTSYTSNSHKSFFKNITQYWELRAYNISWIVKPHHLALPLFSALSPRMQALLFYPFLLLFWEISNHIRPSHIVFVIYFLFLRFKTNDLRLPDIKSHVWTLNYLTYELSTLWDHNTKQSTLN